MRKVLLLVLVLVLVPASSFGAQFYLGAGLGNDVEGGSLRSGLENVSDSNGDRSRLFLGVKVLKHLAVEVARYDFGEQTCCRQIADLAFDTESDGFSAAALGLWPMRYGTAFVKAGALSWEEDGVLQTLVGPNPVNEDGVDPFFGVGFDVTLIGKLGLRLEWERYDFDDASSDGLWASLFFRIN